MRGSVNLLKPPFLTSRRCENPKLHPMILAIICDDEFLARRIPEQEVDVLVSLGDLPYSVILEVADRCSVPPASLARSAIGS